MSRLGDLVGRARGALGRGVRSVGDLVGGRGLRADGGPQSVPPWASRGSGPFYEAAAQGRRTEGFHSPDTGPLSTVVANGQIMRARARAVHRNTVWAKSSRRVWKVNAVGLGIKPRFLFEDDTWSRAARQLWDDWTPHADAHGEQVDFYGLQSLIMGELEEAGEVFVRFRPRRASDELPVPLQLQLLESEHVPYWYTMPLDNGGWIQAGVEYNAIGDVVAYHLYQHHPGEYATQMQLDGYALKRIPASQILHLFDPERAESVRGVPWLVASIMRLKGLHDYEDAELERQIMASMMSGVIELLDQDKASDKIGELHEAWINGRGGAPFTHIEPGTIPVLGAGESFKPFPAAELAGRYLDFITQNLRAIAAESGIPYEILTGDLSHANYSSLKAGSNEFRRRCQQVREHIINHQFNRPVVNRWLDLAVGSGALSAPKYEKRRTEYQRVKWIPQGWPWLEPAKEIGAAVEEARAGLNSLPRIVAERTGEDFETIADEIAATNKAIDQRKLVLDSDPRAIAKPATGKSAQTESTQAETADESTVVDERTAAGGSSSGGGKRTGTNG